MEDYSFSSKDPDGFILEVGTLKKKITFLSMGGTWSNFYLVKQQFFEKFTII